MFILPVILEPSRRTTNAADEAAEPADEGQQAFGDLFSKVLGKSISTDTHAPGGARKQTREEMQGHESQEPVLEPEAQSVSSEPAGPVDEVHLSSESDAAEGELQVSEADVETAGEVQPDAGKADMQWMLAGESIVPPESVSAESAIGPTVMMLDAEGRIVPQTGGESDTAQNKMAQGDTPENNPQARTILSDSAQQVRMVQPMTKASSMPEESQSSSNSNTSSSAEPVKAENSMAETMASAPAPQTSVQAPPPVVQTGEAKVEPQAGSSAESAEQPAPEGHLESEPPVQKSEPDLKIAREPVVEDEGTAEESNVFSDESDRPIIERRPETSPEVQKETASKPKTDLPEMAVEDSEPVEPEIRTKELPKSQGLEDADADTDWPAVEPKPDPAVALAPAPRNAEPSLRRVEAVEVKVKDTAAHVEDEEAPEAEVEMEFVDDPDLSFTETAEQEAVHSLEPQAGRLGRAAVADGKLHRAGLDAEKAAGAAKDRPVEPQQKSAETGKETMGNATDLFRNNATVRTTAVRSTQGAKTFLHQVLVQSTGRASLEGGLARTENMPANAGVFSSAFDRIEKLQELMDNIDQHVLSLAVGSEKTMTITLVPESLGKVVLSCRESNGQMVVEIQAASTGVKDMLQKQEDSLRQMLEQNGFKLAQFDVKTQNDNSRDRRSATRADQDMDDEFEPFQRPRTGAVSETTASAPSPSSQGRGIWYVA